MQLSCRTGLLRGMFGCADQHWSTVMGGPRLSIPGQTHSQLVNDVDPGAMPEPLQRGQGREFLPKRDFPDRSRASKALSPAKRRKFGADDAEMEDPDLAAASPSLDGYVTPAHVRHSSSDLISLQVRLLQPGDVPSICMGDAYAMVRHMAHA